MALKIGQTDFPKSESIREHVAVRVGDVKDADIQPSPEVKSGPSRSRRDTPWAGRPVASV